MYFSTCGLILSSTIVESVFLMVFSSVIGRRFFGVPFGFPGFGNSMILPALMSRISCFLKDSLIMFAI